MLYIFGDSWGYSYVNPTRESFGDEIYGKCLGNFLSDILQQPVKNRCRRKLSNSDVFRVIRSTTFAPNDVLLVLQTDPIRSVVVNWRLSEKDQVAYPLIENLTLEDITRKSLDSYYTQLAHIQKNTGVTVVLHGGCSLLNKELAEQHNLRYTQKTSTEAIIPGFEDSYYFYAGYVARTHEHLLKNKLYRFDRDHILNTLEHVENKENVWEKHPELFTFNHTTEQGTEIVAEYLAQQLLEILPKNIDLPGKL